MLPNDTASYSISFAVDLMGLLQESASEGLLERSWSLIFCQRQEILNERICFWFENQTAFSNQKYLEKNFSKYF
jgi:hypothetical protein